MIYKVLSLLNQIPMLIQVQRRTDKVGTACPGKWSIDLLGCLTGQLKALHSWNTNRTQLMLSVSE